MKKKGLPFRDDCRDICEKRKKTVTEENGRKHILLNPTESLIMRYRVDGCLISDEQSKCDFLISVGEIGEDGKSKVIYLIELKGADLRKAIEQIDRVVEYLNRMHVRSESVQARIILSKAPGPAINSTEEIRLKRKLHRLNGTLMYRTRQMEETC